MTCISESECGKSLVSGSACVGYQNSSWDNTGYRAECRILYQIKVIRRVRIFRRLFKP